MTTLLTAQSRPVLECFSGIMANIIEALNDVLRTDDINGLGNGQQIDSLIINVNISPNSPTSLFDLDDADYITEHDHRRKQLAATDPVHTIVLKDFLQVQVSTLIKSRIHLVLGLHMGLYSFMKFQIKKEYVIFFELVYGVSKKPLKKVQKHTVLSNYGLIICIQFYQIPKQEDICNFFLIIQSVPKEI